MRVVVTGGGGFLGLAIVEALRGRGDDVTALARSQYPSVEVLGARSVAADIRDTSVLASIFRGHDAVIHAAAKAGVWGDPAEYRAINVDGTRNVVAAAKSAGLRALVFTGSPSATFDGRDSDGGNEQSHPLATHFEAPYPETKAEAERLVLAAHSEKLRTTCVRPHLIYGAADPHLLPRLIDRHEKGRLVRVGDGRNKVGLTYVENAAAAHVQALDALLGHGRNGGKSYFITDAEPVVLWDWIGAFFKGIGMPPVTRAVSRSTAETVGGVAEWIWRTFKLADEPPMTKFAAQQIGATHWYDLSAAVADFGYRPPVTGERGLAITTESFRPALLEL